MGFDKGEMDPIKIRFGRGKYYYGRTNNSHHPGRPGSYISSYLWSNNLSVRLCNFFESFIHALGKAAKAELRTWTEVDRARDSSREISFSCCCPRRTTRESWQIRLAIFPYMLSAPLRRLSQRFAPGFIFAFLREQRNQQQHTVAHSLCDRGEKQLTPVWCKWEKFDISLLCFGMPNMKKSLHLEDNFFDNWGNSGINRCRNRLFSDRKKMGAWDNWWHSYPIYLILYIDNLKVNIKILFQRNFWKNLPNQFQDGVFYQCRDELTLMRCKWAKIDV